MHEPMKGDDAAPPPHAAVNTLVPFVHVADVVASLDFYALLGFRQDALENDDAGRPVWAFASTSPAAAGPDRHTGAQIMFARASGPIDPAQQAVIFYVYADDVAALRRHLLSRGLADGGTYRGQPGPNHGRRVVFEIGRPEHMPAGELRIADPDGYCILVGQLR